MAKTGITRDQVLSAIHNIVNEGQKPSIERIRKQIGGSPNTILFYLNEWRDTRPSIEEQISKLSPEFLKAIELFKNSFAKEIINAKIEARKDIDGELIEERKEVASISGLCEELETANSKLQEQQDSIIDECKKLTVQVEKQQLDINRLSNDVDKERNTAEIARIETVQALNKVEILENLKEELCEARSQQLHLTTEKSNIERELAVATAERDMTRGECVKGLQEIATLKQELESLRNVAVESEKDLAVAISEREMVKQDNQRLRDNNQHLQNNIVDLQDELTKRLRK